MAVLTTGSSGLQTGTGVPASIAVIAQGVLLLGAALVFAARQRRARTAIPELTAKPAEQAP